jgi:mannosyl-3-phosphoglycerate phosphatase
MQLAVFTDLDGTLLDHDTYSCQDARPALARLRDRQIPLVFTTSKTRAEVEALQASMGIREPFIVENGAAVYFPDGYRGWRIDSGFRQPPYTVIQLGTGWSKVRRFVWKAKRHFNIQGFGDLSVEAVAGLSGLSEEQARLAKQREFTEPFVIDDDGRLPELQRVAAAAGFRLTRGGRFHHLMGSGQDKGLAVRRTAAVMRRNTDRRLVTIGLGDSANDTAMLASVDVPILIPRPDGSYEDVDRPNLRRAGRPGSRGWNDTVLELLDTMDGKSE